MALVPGALVAAWFGGRAQHQCRANSADHNGFPWSWDFPKSIRPEARLESNYPESSCPESSYPESGRRLDARRD
ncbi:MAG: hypothetical protein N2C14_04500 [Planctomycetales bacterium]